MNIKQSDRLHLLVEALETGNQELALRLAREAKREHETRIDAGKVRDLPKAVESFIAWWKDYSNDNRHVSRNDVGGQVNRLTAAWQSHIGDPDVVPRLSYIEREVSERPHTETLEEHESFGMIQVNRVQGRARLFGSSVDHLGFFQVAVYRGQRRSNEWGERFMATDLSPIVKVSLSPAQFVEFVTTQNQGTGIPCTIESVEGVSMDTCPVDMESELQKIRVNFRKRLDEALANIPGSLKSLDELLAKKTLNKDDRNEIRSAVAHLARVLQDMAPHTLKMFSEATEKHIAKGKHELETYMELILGSLRERGAELPDVARTLSLPAGEDSEGSE